MTAFTSMTLTWNVRYSCAMSVLMLEQPKWSRRCSNAHAAHWKWVHDTFMPCQTQKVLSDCASLPCISTPLGVLFITCHKHFPQIVSDMKVSFSHTWPDLRELSWQHNKNFQTVYMSTIPAIKASVFSLQKYTQHHIIISCTFYFEKRFYFFFSFFVRQFRTFKKKCSHKHIWLFLGWSNALWVILRNCVPILWHRYQKI